MTDDETPPRVPKYKAPDFMRKEMAIRTIRPSRPVGRIGRTSF